MRLNRTMIVALVVMLAPSAAVAQLQGGLTLQSGSSNVTAGGDALGTPVTQQGAGSLTTSYTGTIGVNSLDLSGLQISFSASTSFTAGISGSWQPASGGVAGSAPANYGGLINLGILGGARFSIRNLTGTISTLTPLALTPLGGGVYSFPSTEAFTLLSPSVLDYAGFGLAGPTVGAGSLSLDGVTEVNAGSAATLTDLGGGNFSLIFPISLVFTQTFGGQPAHITLNGSFSAFGQLSPVPEPSTVLSVGALAIVAAGIHRRRRSPQIAVETFA